MSLPEERAARNEALFREVNEQARSLSDRQTERVGPPLAVYEAVRANPRRFVVAPGHDSDFERVVERSDGYAIVEKEGRAGVVAERTNPRT